MIRFEKFSNGHTMPTDWDGAGQPVKFKTIAPTEWKVLVHDPDRWEGCELHAFDSPEKRQEFIDNYKK